MATLLHGINMQPEIIDPQVKNLVTAIGRAETGGITGEAAYKAYGSSGEYGRYQFMPNTWKEWAAESGVNTPLQQATIEEQNKVAYNKVKNLKAQGYSPAEIASIWNSGDPKSYTGYRSDGVTPTKGRIRNSAGVDVDIDVPSYAMKVSQAYRELQGQGATLPQQDVPMPQQAPQGNEPQGYINDIGSSLAESGGKLANAIGDTVSGKINPVSGLIRTAGAGLGAVGDVTDDILSNTPVVGGIYRGLTDIIGSAAGGVMESEAGQAGIKKYGEFAAKHPELAGNIEPAIDIATALPLLRGFKKAKEGVKGAVGNVLHGKTDDALETVSAPLTPKETARALATRGTTKKGLLGDVHLADDPFDVKVKEAVTANVPKFNPSKGLLYNINETRNSVNRLKNDLKKTMQELGQDRIYSFRELGSSLSRVEMPDIVAADETLARLHGLLIQRALNIAKKKGGKVSNLLDVRQEFDNMIKKQYGDIYSSERYSPLKSVVMEIRNELNDFTARNLPEGSGYEDSLLDQHLLLEALENMSEKASKGATKELGVTPMGQFGKKHPIIKGLAKTGGVAAAQGAGLGAFTRLLD